MPEPTINTTATIPTEQIDRQEEITVNASSLQVPIDDNDLIAIIDNRIKLDDAYYRNELKLDRRTEEMVKFWLGDQLDERLFHNWQVPFKDNIIWQNLEQRIAIAAGRMPDIIVTPADETPEKVKSAKSLEKVLDVKVKNDVSKRLVKDGLRNLHLWLKGAIKVRWDKNRGPNGDYVFELVRPTRFGMDHTATIPHDGFTADNMEMIYEWIEEPVGLIVSKYPAKKDELFKLIGIIRGTPRQLVAKIKYLEVHFSWFGNDGKLIEGVAWRYKSLILGKSKDPNWDWEGYEKATDTMDEQGNATVDTIYHNHFDRPRKPYIFFTYQNLGRSPVDDTSAVEQAIPIQRIVNKRGRQITEISDRAVPKIAFAGMYIDKEEARRVTNDPDEHIWLQGADDIRKAVVVIPANATPPILYQDLVGNRSQIDSKFATHATTRGEAAPNESGISKQITREGDLVAADDLSSIVVERVIYEMANWAVQMMKLNYDKPHMIKNVGRDGELIFNELTQDKIDDGIAVNVKSSSVDKQTRRADALQLAARKAIDPLTLYEDLDVSNPKERAKRLISFLNGAADGYAMYSEVVGIRQEMGGTTPPAPDAGGGVAAPAGPDQQATLDIQTLEAGQEPQPPQPPTPEYIQTFVQYVKGGGLDQQSPETQELFTRYLETLKQTIGGVQ